MDLDDLRESFVQFFSDLYVFCVLGLFSLYYRIRPRKAVPKVKNDILLKSASELTELIRNGELSIRELIQAQIDRIDEVNPIVNAVIENNFEEAVSMADLYDAQLSQMSPSERSELSIERPLFGIPFTAKDSISVKGKKYELGFYAYKGRRAEENAVAIDRMLNAGAIFLGVTNVPELTYWIEGNNVLYGYTNNPYDNRRMTGGSSSGEGAIIAACGSPIGIGSDIGGSIRVPAAMNGIFGLKPTSSIIPNDKIGPDFTNPYINEWLNMGPLARKTDDLRLAFKVLGGANAQKLLEDISKFTVERILTIKENKWFGVPRLEKEQRTVFEEAVAFLKRRFNSNVQQIDISRWQESAQKCFHAHAMNDESFRGSKEIYEKAGGKYNSFFELIKYFLGISKHSLSGVFGGIGYWWPKDDEEREYYLDLFEKYRLEGDEIVGTNAIIVMPAWPHAAPFHDVSVAFRRTIQMYTMPFNMVDLPVVSIPMGLNSDGLPLGIAISGPKGSDGLLINIAEELEKKFGGWVDPSCQSESEEMER